MFFAVGDGIDEGMFSHALRFPVMVSRHKRETPSMLASVLHIRVPDILKFGHLEDAAAVMAREIACCFRAVQ